MVLRAISQEAAPQRQSIHSTPLLGDKLQAWKEHECARAEGSALGWQQSLNGSGFH
jgi:hypothetical protein